MSMARLGKGGPWGQTPICSSPELSLCLSFAPERGYGYPSSLCKVGKVTLPWVTGTLGLGSVPLWLLLGPSSLPVCVGAGVA